MVCCVIVCCAGDKDHVEITHCVMTESTTVNCSSCLKKSRYRMYMKWANRTGVNPVPEYELTLIAGSVSCQKVVLPLILALC